MDLDRGQATLLDVKISEICVKSCFLKIFAQNLNSLGYHKIQGLEQFYRTLKADSVALNDVCMLKSEGECYRCRILEINDDQAKIYLIDCGFYATYPLKLLRLIPRDNPLFSMPPVCKDYYIAGIKIDTNVADYKQKIRNTAYKMLRNKFVQIKVAGELPPLAPCAHVFIKSLSFAEEIIPQDPIMVQVLNPISIVDQLSALNDIHKVREPDLERYSLSGSPEACMVSQSFGSRKKFAIGSEHEVQVVVPGAKVSEFYVNFMNEKTEMDEFFKSLCRISLIKVKTLPAIGSKCIAMLWLDKTKGIEVYRVIIKGVEGEQVKIHLFDKGKEIITDFSHLYTTSDKIATDTPPFAVAFSLHGVERAVHLNEDEREFYFHYLVRNRKLILTVKPSYNQIPECSLTDKYHSNADILSLMEAYDPRSLTYPIQKPLQVGQKYIVQITSPLSPESFFITLYDERYNAVAHFDKLLRGLHACEFKCPSPGNICYVIITNKFFRGKYIKRISPSVCKVQLVDTGLVCDVDHNNVKIMVDTHLNYAPAAYHCTTPLGISDDQFFKKFTSHLNKYATIEVTDYKDQKYAIQILAVNKHADKLSTSIISEQWSIHSFKNDDICRISYVNSINCFTIQLIATIPEYEQASAKWQHIIAKVENVSLQQFEYTKDQIYITKHKQSDKFIRVGIFKDEGDVKIFRNIDDGSLIEIKAQDKVFAAPSELTLTPPFGIPCSLPCHARKRHVQEADEFLMQYIGKDLIYKIINCGFDCNIIELSDAGLCITTEMKMLNFIKRNVSLLSGYGYIHFICNLNEFYIQHEKDKRKLCEIIEHNVNYQRIPIEKPKRNMIVMAKFSKDNTWNRARILWENPDQKYFVQYIDFGNRNEVNLDEIGEINNLFIRNTEAMAYECGLDFPDHLNAISLKAISHFEKFAFSICEDKDNEQLNNAKLSNRIKFEFLRMNKNKNIVKIFDKDGKDLLESLQKLCNPVDLQEPEWLNYSSSSEDEETTFEESFDDYYDHVKGHQQATVPEESCEMW